MFRLCRAAALLMSMAAAWPAAAQTYPSKPMRVIASSAAGGISDVFMRTLGEELHKRWGQPIIVENRVGGNFTIGARACSEAPADGYTICIMSNEAVTYNLYLYKKLPFDLVNGIVPLTNLFFINQVLAVNSDLKIKTVDELVALARPSRIRELFRRGRHCGVSGNLNKLRLDIVQSAVQRRRRRHHLLAPGVTRSRFSASALVGHLRSGQDDRAVFDAIGRSALFRSADAARHGLSRAADARYFRFYAPPECQRLCSTRSPPTARRCSEPAFRDRISPARSRACCSTRRMIRDFLHPSAMPIASSRDAAFSRNKLRTKDEKNCSFAIPPLLALSLNAPASPRQLRTAPCAPHHHHRRFLPTFSSRARE